MAMSWRLVVIGLLFLGLTVTARPNSLPIGVLFHPEDNHLQYIAFKYALHRINADTEILPEHELTPITVNVSQDNSFGLGKKVCNMIKSNGVAAIFGPRAPVSLGIVQSICETLEIPNLSTATSHGGYPARCFVNLYPSQEELSKAMTDVVRGFLHWRSFTILYEDDEGLFRLQEVLKSHGPDADPIIVRQFLPGDDQRQLLKEVQASNAVHILLDCHTDRVINILQQAKELGMMGDYQSYFITSLDTHTLDFSQLAEGHTNITSLRLIDPDNILVSSTVKFWTDWETHYKRHLNVTPETVRVDMALMHDSVFLFARALHQLYPGKQKVAVRKLECDGVETWHQGFSLANYMKLMKMDGMTGEIKFDALGRRSGLHLDVVEHYGGKFKKVGYWQLENGVIGTQTETEKMAEIEKTLQSKIFIVSTRLGQPFLMVRTGDGLTGNNRYEGYSKDLIDEIAKELQFTYEFKLVSRHNDLVQDLIARRADLGICDLTITHQREQIIDFTMPFMNLGISILYRKPVKEEPRMFAFLDPFSIDVWIYMATAYLGVSILLFVLARTAPGEWDNPHPCNPEPEELENNFKMMNVLWFSIGSLMGQGCDILPKMSPTEWQNRHPCSKPQSDELETNLTMSNCIWHNCGSIMQQGSDIAPQAVSTRMVAGMWWFFTLIMISSYTANLAAFLTLNRMDSTINSAEDLVKQYKIKYGTMDGGSTAAFFKNSNDTTYKRMWTVMDQARPTVFVLTNEEGMDRVKKAKGLYAFFMESTSIEYQVERNCELTQIGNLLDSKGYGIGLPLNSPYRTLMSGAVLKLQERGMLEELKKRWWKVEGGESCSALEEKSAKADSNELGLDNVGGVFVVLIAGTVTAFCVAVLELLWNCRKIAVDEKITPCEALLSELKFAVSCSGTKKASHVKSSEADEEEEEEEEEDEDNMPAGATAGSFVRLGFEKFTEK